MIISRTVYFCLTRRQTYCLQLIQLLETNILGILPEALTAHVQVVLADQSMSVRAGTALARALAVFPGTGVPHSFETHVFFLLYGTVLTKLLFETSFHHEIVFEMRYVAQECFDYKS